MGYFELRIGNSFKDENECDEFDENFAKLIKVIMLLCIQKECKQRYLE